MKNETRPAKQTSNLYRTNVFNNEKIERIKRDTSLAHHMAPEKKAKPRLNLFLYNLPNPACQNPDPEGHLRIQKAQQIDE